MEPPHIRYEAPRDENGIPYNNKRTEAFVGGGALASALCAGLHTEYTAVDAHLYLHIESQDDGPHTSTGSIPCSRAQGVECHCTGFVAGLGREGTSHVFKRDESQLSWRLASFDSASYQPMPCDACCEHNGYTPG